MIDPGKTSARALIGSPVCNERGSLLGHVQDVLLDRRGGPAYLDVRFKSSPGAPVSIPWSQLSVGTAVVLDISEKTLERYLRER